MQLEHSNDLPGSKDANLHKLQAANDTDDTGEDTVNFDDQHLLVRPIAEAKSRAKDPHQGYSS